MKGILPWIGPLVMLGLVVNFASKCGSQWKCGRYGMPSSLLAADGRTYLDGTEVDPVSLAIVRTGREEEFYLVAVVVLVVLIGIAARVMIRFYRTEMERAAKQLRILYRLPPDYKE